MNLFHVDTYAVMDLPFVSRVSAFSIELGAEVVLIKLRLHVTGEISQDHQFLTVFDRDRGVAKKFLAFRRPF